MKTIIDSELRYRRLFEAAQDGILILDAVTGMIEDVNPYLINLLGYSREELVEKKLWEVGAFKDIEASKDAFEALQKNEYIRYEDLPLRAKNGKLVQVEFVSNVYLVGSKNVIQCNIRDITARKQAEVSLRESEERYRQLVEALPDGVVALSQGRIVFANQASAKILGAASPDDLTGMPVIEFVHPDYRGLALKRIQQSLSEGVPAPLAEEIFVRQDGTHIEVEVSGISFSYGGKPAILTVFNDITEHKRAEEEHKAHIRYLESLGQVDQAIKQETNVEKMLWNIVKTVFSIFDCDRAWLFYPCDPDMPSFRVPVEIHRAEYPGANVQDIDVPMSPDLAQNLREALESDDPVTYTSGTDRPINKVTAEQFGVQSQMLFPLYPKVGKPWVFGMHQCSYPRIWTKEEIKLFKEISRRISDGLNSVLFLRELQENEERFRATFEQAAVGIAHVAPNGRWLRVNQKLCDIVGYSREELLQKTFQDITYPEDLDVDLEYVRQMLAGVIPTYSMEKRYIRKDGSQVWVNLTVSVVHQASGEFGYFIFVIEGITERKQSEEQIRRHLEHLKALSAIDRVISSNFDLKLSLSEILAHVKKELGVDAADILLLNSNTQMLEYGAERGFRTKSVKNAQLRLGESYAGRAALERKLVQIPNILDDPDNILLTTLLMGEEFVCYYSVPLIAKGQVKGVLEVFHRATLKPDSEWFDFFNALAGQAAIAIENASLYESLQRSNQELSLAYDATIEGWSRALDLRDKETKGHTQRVTEMTVKLARAFGLSDVDLVQVRWGALMHDIGKMGVPDGILFKPGPLTDEEWVVMKKHPTFAYEMLLPIRYLQAALDIPYCHHEKWDGTGYPQGLKGNQIPLVARIFAVVDVWDALSSDRPYRKAWSKEKVIEHIRSGSGTHFDPHVVDEFMQMLNNI